MAAILPAVLASLVYCKQSQEVWGDHEGEEADEDGGDLPGGVPLFGMEVGEGEAETGVCLEAPCYKHTVESGRDQME